MTVTFAPLPAAARPAWLVLALALAACTPVPPKVDPLPPGLVGTSWRAETITGLAAAPDVASTLSFTASDRIAGPDRIAGNAGCNRYSGPLAVVDAALRLGPLVATRMACPPAPMGQERRFLTALEQGRRFERDGDELSLYSAGRDGPTRFTRLDESEAPPR